jgi:hypothetical protein
MLTDSKEANQTNLLGCLDYSDDKLVGLAGLLGLLGCLDYSDPKEANQTSL